MEMDLEKKLLRKHIKDKISCLSPKSLGFWSEVIQKKVLSLIFFLSGRILMHGNFNVEISGTEKVSKSMRRSQSRQTETNLLSPVVCSYVSLKNEVETQCILEEFFKRNGVLVPRCNGAEIEVVKINSYDDLSPGSYNIPEPKNSCPVLQDVNKLDFIIVPGIGFDNSGNRLGRGKGYYDRLLSKLDEKTVKIGICFDAQIFDSIPNDKSDQRVDYVVSQTRIISASIRKTSLLL
ncbi:MAG: hypothetical protein ACD_79C00517G0006 [uncultured bacterium]|nr:MAG: hypothetical protein ACD_79C00517G0006 [uncultured bacterium]